VLVDGDRAPRQRVTEVAFIDLHDRAPIATVLSFATTRSVWKVKIQFRIRSTATPEGRAARRPFDPANFASNSQM
jgi:hypothetical protein